MDNQLRVTWQKEVEAQFQIILKQIPDMVRGIAETRINKKAEAIVKEDNRLVITEQDMVRAFFAETPAAFKKAMVNSMNELKIDYKQYGVE
jgi:hypothetical protein